MTFRMALALRKYMFCTPPVQKCEITCKETPNTLNFIYNSWGV